MTQAIPIVVLYRVSTKGQKESGLCLETQRLDIEEYKRRFNAVVEKEFYEAKSGKKIENRRVLKAILFYYRKYKRRLVIATLDWLARNAPFIATLIVNKVDFVVATMPEATKLELLQ